MREQVTFAVDPNGSAFYVHVTPETKNILGLPDVGAAIDTRGVGFPPNLEAGFYQGTLCLQRSGDKAAIQWDQIQQARFQHRL